MNKYQEYWKKRNELMFLQGEKDALATARDLERNYKQAINNIQDQINAFYGKYATAANLDISEVRKLLNRNELKSFKDYLADIKDYAKEHKLDKNYINEINKLSYKLRVSRLEELKAKMHFEVEKLTKQVQDKVEDTLLTTYEEGYYRTIFNAQQFFQISSSFTELNLQAIRKAIGTPYMLQNYSDVLWKNKENLKYLLDTAVPQGIILGQNPNKVAQIASKKLTSNYKAAVRLIRTEYNLILNDGAAKGYIEAGIEKYELLATLDDRTSEICQELDGQVFNVNQKEVGVNYPPFHPNCRTTTIPYFEPDEFDVDNNRIAKDNQGKNYYVPANITYEQWQAGLIKQPNGNLRYQSDGKITLAELLVKREFDNDNLIIKKYINKKSKWNGKVKIVKSGNSGFNPDGSITILEDSSKYERMHELLHSYSVAYDFKSYKANKTLEEGSVELLNRAIHKKENLEIGDSGYDEIVDILNDINKSAKLYNNEMEFAIKLFEQPLTDRYDFLFNKISNSKYNDMDILNKLSELDGSDLVNAIP